MNVSPSKKSGGIVNNVSGSFTSDGTAAVVTIGFAPQTIRVFNETDVISWEKFATQSAANTVKRIADGTTTKDTGSAVVINSNGSFTISATAAGTSKVIHFVAIG